MKLIIGLGNPGPRYARTRHNLGFMVADQLAATLDAKWKSETKLKSELTTAELDGTKLLLAKPQTFMNLSGEAVQRIMQMYKVDPGDVWVIADDLDVPFGRLRLRIGGTSGHQGYASVISHIGGGFIRARVGISMNDRNVEASEDYVLKPFDEDEREHLPQIIASAATIIAQQLPLSMPEETTFALLK